MVTVLKLGSLPQFVRFGIVGCMGFVVDSGVLYASIYLLGTGFYTGRVLSYISAATATWYLNRVITFSQNNSNNLGAEWARFVACNAVGGGVNYGVYVAYLHFATHSVFTPVIGVALGSCASLCVNYWLSRQLVFKKTMAAS